MPASLATAEFLDGLLAIEDAWTLLDDTPSRERIEQAIALGGHGTQVLIRAADRLDQLGDPVAARQALERGLTIGGPTAPLLLALARQLRAMNDPDGAARRLREAMLRARPGAALLAELAVLDLEAGNAGCASAIVAALGRLRLDDPPVLVEMGRRLRDLGRPDLALTTFLVAQSRGYGESGFMADLGALLARDDLPVPDEALRRAVGGRVASFKLSHHYRGDPVTQMVRAREQSDRWVDADRLRGVLRDAIARRRPYSAIRLGDGEARFLLLHHHAPRDPLDEAEIRLIVTQIWRNWFGQDIDEVDAERLAALSARFGEAIDHADLLGVTTAARLDSERELFGSLVALERHIAGLAPTARLTDSLAILTLNERDPFFASILGGLDFLGVVSPHTGLAERLAGRLGIAEVASYVIPAESRLGRPGDAADRGTHFPAVYDRIMADMEVPREGAVFLVAGGLLGKVYCDRIKQLGGIALDVGSVVDAWMGINTRGIVLDRSMQHRLVP